MKNLNTYFATTQLVSSSVALPAELVSLIKHRELESIFFICEPNQTKLDLVSEMLSIYDNSENFPSIMMLELGGFTLNCCLVIQCNSQCFTSLLYKVDTTSLKQICTDL